MTVGNAVQFTGGGGLALGALHMCIMYMCRMCVWGRIMGHTVCTECVYGHALWSVLYVLNVCGHVLWSAMNVLNICVGTHYGACRMY